MKKIFFIHLILSCLSLAAAGQRDSAGIKYIVEVPLVDVPANTDQGGLAYKQFSPSMQQSLALTRSFAEAQQYYTKRIFFKPGKDYSLGRKVLREAAVAGCNAVVEFIISGTPFGTGWTHEEWHRAVMNKNNVRSYNDMNRFPIGQSTVSVSRETDADLARFKQTNNPDFVRMGIAGIEAQYEYVKSVQQHNFFYGLNLSSQVSYWFNNLNSIEYVKLCSTKEADDDTKKMETDEGTDISKRDFTGYDFIGWVYDLSRPDEAYASRGIHPSGNGIRRYRRTTDLTTEELDYLKKMGKLQMLNLISPHMFFVNSIRISDDLRFNFAAFHYLTSFGYDAGSNFFVEYKQHKVFFALHNYHNLHHGFYGIEAQLIDQEYRIGGRTIRLTPGIHIWTQPRNQEFRTADAAIGGKAGLCASTLLGRIWGPYIVLSAKTEGWVAGDVYLGSNFSARAGICAYVH